MSTLQGLDVSTFLRNALVIGLLVLSLFMVVVFVFRSIRDIRNSKDLANLAKGDVVRTKSGLVAEVLGVDGNCVDLASGDVTATFLVGSLDKLVSKRSDVPARGGVAHEQ